MAPGIDIERDILARMDFKPLMPRDPAMMDPAIFGVEPMNLRERMLAVPLAQRLAYDDEHNVLFINFERLSVRTRPTSRRATRRSSAGSMRSGTRCMAS